MIRILIVEDSRVVRLYLQAVLRDAEGIEVVGTSADGIDAVAQAIALRPDVILMDLQLPGQSGLHAIQDIMAEAPCPIIVLSGLLQTSQCKLTFEALRLGALDALRKPEGVAAADVADFRGRLLCSIRGLIAAMGGRRKLTRRIRTTPRQFIAGLDDDLTSPSPLLAAGRAAPVVVAIGASTGGPATIQAILSAIPAPFPLPILITQHIMAGFAEGYAAWLNGTKHAVRVGSEGDDLLPGVVLVSPGDRHMVLGADDRVHLEPADAFWPCPSVDALLASVARSFDRRAFGIVLTGMGRDGALGLLALRAVGARTVAQSPESCVINGMPQAAVDADAAEAVLSPSGLVDVLKELATHV